MKRLLLQTIFITVIFYSNAQTVTDIDNNVYNTVTIGTQVWMAENLKTTKFNDGTSIPLVIMFTEWNNLTTPAYCWHNNDELNYKDKYGALYNWYTVNTCKICPSGWHVPTDADWTTLTTYLGGANVAGGKMKGTDFWQSPNTGATNESGFAARPGACRLDDFSLLGSSGYWWSSSEFDKNNAWFRLLSYNSGGVLSSINGKTAGFSVRCIKDNNTSMTNSFNSGEMIFYPNPATDRLYLKNNNYANTIIMIFDLQDRQVLSKQLDSNPIDISNLGKGIYIAKLVGSGNVLVNKFIKE